VILGAGMTGLAAGLVSGLPILEASEFPGGICSSYYLRPNSSQRLHVAPRDGNAYRFEIGGGHWIFGGDPVVLRLVRSLVEVRTYVRKSTVYFPDRELVVPYPIQNHLRYFGTDLAVRALREMTEALSAVSRTRRTMADWLRESFGPTLCELFFDSFHDLYTAGLWKRIRPQDGYKSPVNLSLAIQGAFGDAPPVGYNATFVYPAEGLNTLAQRMAVRCKIHYGKRVVRIDSRDKALFFDDQSVMRYTTVLSTLPLNRMMELAGLTLDEEPDPSPSVLVINIGATKGPRCPGDHWVYVPRSNAGFHRAGFYSNVDPLFLPSDSHRRQDRVSIYVEKAYPDGQKPTEVELRAVCRDVLEQLQAWGWIEAAEVVDPTWIDVAYTWSWPGSTWRERALQVLESHEIYQVGRFARWVFQGIADSIRDGLMAGGAMDAHGLSRQDSG